MKYKQTNSLKYIKTEGDTRQEEEIQVLKLANFEFKFI